MENKKGKIALNDDLLDKVSGGFDIFNELDIDENLCGVCGHLLDLETGCCMNPECSCYDPFNGRML